MKVSFISTYPPRQCGIGSFSNSLINALYSNNERNSIESLADIIAINDTLKSEDYPNEVKFLIDQQSQQDYIKASEFINLSDSRLCILQHEFGIFGGDSGIYILPLIHQLKVPLIVILHTVLKHPSFLEKAIVTEIGKTASKVIVMSKLGAEFLSDIYHLPASKIVVIPHGVPQFDIRKHQSLKRKFHYENKKLLMTFGLIGRNKGIETVINALPEVIKKHPEVVYLVLGNTHPNVIQASGESYRHYLKLLIRSLNLQGNVFFIKQFLPQKTLLQYLTAADIYITPYLNEAQITSGTLSYAIGAGAACVSTPFWHAKELLSEHRGVLYDFKDSTSLANILIDLLDHPVKLKQLKKRAYSYGKERTWNHVGQQYRLLFKTVIKDFIPSTKIKEKIIDPAIMPPLNLSHLKRLTDDTGIVQHAKYGIPNLKEGYCLDDNARALLAALTIYRRTKNKEALDLIPIYFSYIHYMQNTTGTFRNFLSFNRQFLDKEGSEDSFGRTIWALGYLIRYSPNDAYHQLASEIFKKATPNFERLCSLRGMANSIIGICHYLEYFQTDEQMVTVLEDLVSSMAESYQVHNSKGWHWFEDILTYDNAVLPLALFHSLNIIDNHKVHKIARESLLFLEQITITNSTFSPIGSNGWYKKGCRQARYPQQATDVMVMILLYEKAFEKTRQKSDLKNMFKCFTWFLGENDLRIPLFDHETNGCCDGLESYGVNRNQGAESTLAYLISYMNVLNALENESTASSKVDSGIILRQVTGKDATLEPGEEAIVA